MNDTVNRNSIRLRDSPQRLAFSNLMVNSRFINCGHNRSHRQRLCCFASGQQYTQRAQKNNFSETTIFHEQTKIKTQFCNGKIRSQINLIKRGTGIEPAQSAWEAEILPLNYPRRIYCHPACPSTSCSQAREERFLRRRTSK